MNKLSRVQRKMRRRRIFFSIIFTLATVFALFMLILNTKFFAINNIRVLGNNKVLANKIILLSSIQEGENIFKISTTDGEKNIIKLPYIKNVKIKRKFPREIVINIEERKEAMQIKDISSFVVLDKDGYILDNVSEKDEKLTEIIGLNFKNKDIGENIFIENENKDEVEFIKTAEDLDMLSKFIEINMEDNRKINILLFNEIKVVFGTINNVKYKLNLLNEVLDDIEDKQLDPKMILMDKGENPIVVLKDKEEG